MAYLRSELKTAIQDYCQNSETSFVNHLNDFVISTEDKIFSAIQMASFWKSQTFELVIGTAERALEAGSLDVFSVRVSEADPSGTPSEVTYGPVRYLVRKDYDFLLEAYPGAVSAQKTGIPKYYAVSSASVSGANPTITIRLGPPPDDQYYCTVDYYGKASTDSLVGVASDAYTWLSASFPQVLLNGCLVEAYAYMKGEPDLIQNYQSQFQEGLAMMKNFGEGRQTADSYTDGTKRITPQ